MRITKQEFSGIQLTVKQYDFASPGNINNFPDIDGLLGFFKEVINVTGQLFFRWKTRSGRTGDFSPKQVRRGILQGKSSCVG